LVGWHVSTLLIVLQLDHLVNETRRPHAAAVTARFEARSMTMPSDVKHTSALIAAFDCGGHLQRPPGPGVVRSGLPQHARARAVAGAHAM
jgi:hypothetical protein